MLLSAESAQRVATSGNLDSKVFFSQLPLDGVTAGQHTDHLHSCVALLHQIAYEHGSTWSSGVHSVLTLNMSALLQFQVA